MFSGDTGYKEDFAVFCSGADLLLLNAAYTDEEVEKIEEPKGTI